MFKQPKTKSSSFSPSNYCVLFSEVMEVDESRENFFKYLGEEALCGECVDFLNDFSSFSHEFQKVKNLVGKKPTTRADNEENEHGSIISSSSSLASSSGVCLELNDESKDENSLTLITGNKMILEKIENLGVMVSAIKKLFVMADRMIFEHVQSGVLNVPSWIIKETKNYWTVGVLEKIREMILLRSSTLLESDAFELNINSLLENVNEDNIDPWFMIRLVTPSKLLLRLYENILIDLKLDTFSRYSRSEYLYQFLEKMGETFTTRIAIHVDELSDDYSSNRVSTTNSSSEIIAKPKKIRLRSDDWNSNTFSKEFIFSCLYYAEDSPRWKQTIQAKQKPFPQTCYITENDFVMGKNSTGQKCTKVVMDIPYNRDFVYALYSSSLQRIELDPWMKGFNYFGMTTNEHSMTTTALEVIFSFGPLQKRSSTILATNIYDPDADCFMFFFKTKEFEEYQRTPNTVPSDGFMVFLFYKHTDNSTRFVNVFFGDLKLPFSNDFTFNFATSFGLKKINKLLEKVAKKYLPQYEEFERLNGIPSYYDYNNPEDYVDSIFKFKDDLKFYESVKQNLIHFPVKSWHREFYKEMKESR
ncbi:predicted protein [Naegleria gruberi]|uniref:Predicted protein n=1 Tax=Naegleria gruberi TaxID=5762 RepID=D2V381_NAEGR|nr:uncharacterized protein NAEGRDRAFT_78384 [Naegleria gruberi]EFC48588.1 predicted protein [Naegleria gruberi]|eukprot:XP_002681332.1 predicted protein [Naegleria gruberi strain NEG-M]